MQLRWDRILAVLLILISPVIIGWLNKTIHIGPFRNVPIIGELESLPEAKALLLLAILLLGVILAIKALRL